MPDIVSDSVNVFLEGLVEVVNFLLDWLPDSPFKEPIAAMRSSLGSELLGYFNYFLPISEFLTVLSAWVAAIALYYAVSIVLRWAKAVS